MGKEGGKKTGQLAELLNMILERRRWVEGRPGPTDASDMGALLLLEIVHVHLSLCCQTSHPTLWRFHSG